MSHASAFRRCPIAAALLMFTFTVSCRLSILWDERAAGEAQAIQQQRALHENRAVVSLPAGVAVSSSPVP